LKLKLISRLITCRAGELMCFCVTFDVTVEGNGEMPLVEGIIDGWRLPALHLIAGHVD